MSILKLGKFCKGNEMEIGEEMIMLFMKDIRIYPKPIHIKLINLTKVEQIDITKHSYDCDTNREFSI